MPKKNGKVKTYSFSEETLKQINSLSAFFMLKPTNLIEFLINKECKEIENAKKTQIDERIDRRTV